MPKRSATWKPSDIRGWKGRQKASRPPDSTPEPMPLSMDTKISVTAGRMEWTERLEWIAPLLTASELKRLAVALGSAAALRVPAKANRAEMTLALAKSERDPAEPEG